jgi:hypothetical protein
MRLDVVVSPCVILTEAKDDGSVGRSLATFTTVAIAPDHPSSQDNPW